MLINLSKYLVRKGAQLSSWKNMDQIKRITALLTIVLQQVPFKYMYLGQTVLQHIFYYYSNLSSFILLKHYSDNFFSIV